MVGNQHLRHARKLGRTRRRRPAVVTRHENMKFATQRKGGRQRLGCRAPQRRIRMVGKKQNGHYKIPASVLSLPTSSATLPTLIPAFRVGGSAVLRTFKRGVMSTPKSSGVFTSNGFFFAFMILGSAG